MCPTYLNSTATVVTVGSTRIEPGESKETYETIRTPLPTGITKTSDAPYASNSNIVSESYTGDDTEVDTITVPTGNFTLDLDIYCVTGRVDVFFNSASNTPATSLITGDGFKQCIDATAVSSIILVYAANATIVDLTLA